MAQAKQSIEVSGQRTSLSLEVEFWTALQQIADQQQISVQELIEQIQQGYQPARLTSAIRLFVLKHYQKHAKGLVDVGTDTTPRLRSEPAPR